MRETRFIITAAMVAGLVWSLPAQAVVWGLKCSSSGNGPSQPPTHLFSLSESASLYVDIGAVKIGKTPIDADGLAISATSSLYAFQIEVGGSTLISIDSTTAAATTIGSQHAGRTLRGAVFDLNGLLWAVDNIANELLRIDPATGAIIGTPVAITLNNASVDVHVFTDLAIRCDGTMLLLTHDEPNVTDLLYTINSATGALSLVGAITGAASPGATFSSSATSPDFLFTFEAQGCDDINRHDLARCLERVTLIPNIMPLYFDCPYGGNYQNPDGFNAGPGDMAAVVTASAQPVHALGVDCNNNGQLDCLEILSGGGPDCNNNSTPDCIDIAFGVSHDCNGNGVPDECQAACDADITSNGVVNIDDLLAVINSWGNCP